VAAGIALLVGPGPARAGDRSGERFFDLVRGGQPVATLVAPAEQTPVWDDAVALITATAARWGGAGPKVVRLAREAPPPAGDLILLGTTATSRAIADRARLTGSPVSRVAFGDAHGFAVEAHTEGESRQLVLAGKTPRGAYNAAVYCRDFLLDATPGEAGKADVFVRAAAVVRSPRLAARGTYHLSIYGRAMTYTAEDWMKVIDRDAEDGIERVYFWLSGHHPSKKYPHLYNVDATHGTRLTVDGVRRLIRHCHDRGIRFYIGGGVFAWTAAHYVGQGHPEVAAMQGGGLCPSKPFARKGTREHFLEMYETWPEADGFMFEIRDEQGECRCPDCRRRLDAFGSRAYGEAEITWLEEFAREAWKRNPRLRFCWLIGYAEHKNDVHYHDAIRHMSDARFEWLDVRVGLDLKGPWRLPGPGGRPRPLAFFSPRIAHWDPFYRMAPADVLTAARRSADEGLAGYVPAFEPGFSTASYYYDQVPLPVNALPYCLTGFVYREATWDPGITFEELKERIGRRYFSPDAPPRFVDDLLYLQQFSFDHWQELCLFAKARYGYGGEKIERLTVEGERRRVEAITDAGQRRAEAERLRATFRKLAAVGEHLKRMDRIEAAVERTAPTATPKTRDGLDLMRRMIQDTRALYRQAVPDPRLLSATITETPEEAADTLLRDIRATAHNRTAASAAARAAWDKLVARGPAVLPRLLEAMDTPDPVVANWLGTAFDRVADADLQAGGAHIDAAALLAFARDARRRGRARRLALDLVERVRPGTRGRLLTGWLDDPEFRDDAVAALTGRGDQLVQSAPKDRAKAVYARAFAAARDVPQAQQLARRLNDLGVRVSLAEHFGFLTDWYVIGPFDGRHQRGYRSTYPPEAKVDLAAELPGKAGQVRWRRYRAQESWTAIPGRVALVNLVDALGPAEDAVAYAYTAFTAPDAREVEFRGAADDNFTVWVNGRRVFRFEEYRNGVRLDRHRFRTRLQAGRNTVLVKVCQAPDDPANPAPNWEFLLRVVDPDGKGLSFPSALSPGKEQDRERH
jgi:hypothetical protein